MELRKLIIKLFLAILLILAGGALIRYLADPSPYYGNDILEEKMRIFSNDTSDYNTVFIGSSIVMRNIDPEYFDLQFPDSPGISSYNLGMGGTLPPETYIFYERLLADYGEQLRYVFIELRDVALFHPHNLHTLRRRYWATPAEYAFVVRSSLGSKMPREYKRKNILYYGITLLERLFLVDYFNDLFGHTIRDPEVREFKRQTIRGKQKRGFLPFDDDATSMRREEFLADSSKLFHMASLYLEHIAVGEGLNCNHPHIRRINHLIDLSKQHNVHCFFVLQPKQNEMQWEEAIALAQHIPPGHLINVADPRTVPELYLAKNSFSENHFNNAGTKVLTRLIAEETKRMMNDE